MYYGDMFSDLLLAARKAHDVQCHCKPSFCDYACIGTSDDPAHFPYPISRHVKLDEKVSDIFDEQSRPVASFVAEEVWRVDPEFPARSKFGDTMPGVNTLRQGMLQSNSGHPRVALKALSAHDLLYSPGLLHKLPLVRRPKGFGKTSFLAMLEFFYDCKHFRTPISDAILKFTRVSDADPNAPFMVSPHHDLVLTFDLKFLRKYQQELVIKPEDIPVFLSEDGTLSFGSVLELTEKRWRRISIFIDNYNAPSIASDNSPEVNSCLNQMIILPLSKSLSSVRGLIAGTGDAPDPLINPYLRSGCDIWTAAAVDITDEDVVDVTFGFTLEDVRELERPSPPQSPLRRGGTGALSLW
ncbi:hypothetical protein ARMSODRAFT_1086674 [Armillaria solidipes]|uniref:AAA-ATPase-like domain-containing protein n=1 Tax=Armillaria solidipes TaxID=1076256 RepID=A0A2H3BC65_9AGAR|nr:hypothetical protein ARMSODRAFT_1086674 [Armillaria solidipes]